MQDDRNFQHYKITEGSTIFTSPDLKGGGGDDNGKTKIREALREVLKKAGGKFDLANDGLNSLIQKSDQKD